jgi:hypothetical protein
MKLIKSTALLSLLASSIAFASPEAEMQKAINQAGERCLKVTQVFSIGKDKENNLHFSVACNGGENYYVLVKRNGDGNVMPCAMADKMAGGRGKPGSCFTKVN